MTQKEVKAQTVVDSTILAGVELSALDQVLFGPGGGRKSGAGTKIEVIRALSEADLPRLEEGSPGTVAVPTLKSIGARHHSIAQKLAQGMTAPDISLCTGYTPQYINQLKNDPAFRELVEYYLGQVDLRFVDVIDRMRTLGLSAVEELQRRIDEKPEDLSAGTLRDLAETMIIKPISAAAAAKTAAQGGAPTKLQIEFVAPKAEPKIIEGRSEA